MCERIAEDRVVRFWLERDLDRREGSLPGDPDPSTLSSEAALDALLSAKPGAASFIWRERPIDWYRLAVSRPAFAALRPVGGPEDLLWRSLSTDGTILGVAERLRETGIEGLDGETDVDLDAIADYRASLRAGESLDPLIVRTRRGATPWYVVDGNHRATAIGLHLLETGQYRPPTAYVGVTANPVLRPLVDRLRGLVQRSLGRVPARR